MTGPIFEFERALVPEYLQKQTIETVPIDQAFYVAPGEHEDYTTPTIFIAPDNRLLMSKTEAIEIEDAYPSSLIGFIGVMHVVVRDGDDFRDTYIADLRFMKENGLIKVDPKISSSAEQEQWADTLDILEDTVTFEAFIAPEDQAEAEEGVIPGSYYGNPELYRALELLMEAGDEQMKRYIAHEKAAHQNGEAASDDEEADDSDEPTQATEDGKKKPAHLSDPFSVQRD